MDGKSEAHGVAGQRAVERPEFRSEPFGQGEIRGGSRPRRRDRHRPRGRRRGPHRRQPPLRLEPGFELVAPIPDELGRIDGWIAVAAEIGAELSELPKCFEAGSLRARGIGFVVGQGGVDEIVDEAVGLHASSPGFGRKPVVFVGVEVNEDGRCRARETSIANRRELDAGRVSWSAWHPESRCGDNDAVWIVPHPHNNNLGPLDHCI